MAGGGAAKGYSLAGFEVVGVDIHHQPRFPFEFHQADALTFPLDGFDAIHASPPCQAFTNAQKIRGYNHPELIAPIRRRLLATGLPFVIENVDGAPLLDPFVLCGAMFPELRVYRHRLFESNVLITAPKHPAHKAKLTKMGRPPIEGEFMHVVGNFSGVQAARRAMGIDWMTREELREAIPPAYTAYIGSFLRAHLTSVTPVC